MTKIKNKFIIFIISIIVLIIWLWTYNSFSNKVDRNSYVVLLNWNATLNSIPIKKDIKELLSVWDNVRTIWKSSLAVIEWWDWSVTRLWWNSNVKIDNLYLSDNLDTINISFELLNWKSWSNVISFLWKWSYFNQTFSDNLAAVRWTIFDVDLDNNYIYVIDHKVTLTKNDGEIIVINEKEPFDIKNYDFIALEEFIKSFKDKAWEKLNEGIDKEFLDWLRKQIQQDLDTFINIEDLNIDWIVTSEQKQVLYDKIISDYQKLNFIDPSNEDLFKKKIELKDALIKLSTWENKTMLLENTFYDFKNIVDLKKYEDIDLLLPTLWDNTDLLRSLNFRNKVNFDGLPEQLKDKFIELKIIILDKTNEIKNINIDAKLDEIDSGIKWQLDNIVK